MIASWKCFPTDRPMLPQELYKNSTNYKNCCHIKEKICVYFAMSHNFISCSITSQQCYMALKEKHGQVRFHTLMQVETWQQRRIPPACLHSLHCARAKMALPLSRVGLRDREGVLSWKPGTDLEGVLCHAWLIAWPPELGMYQCLLWPGIFSNERHLRKKGETWSNILWR